MQNHHDFISTPLEADVTKTGVNKASLADTSAEFFKRRKGADNVLRIHISRNTSIALIISVLVHLLFLISLAPKLFPTDKPLTQQSLTVSLNPPSKPYQKVEPAPAAEPIEPPKPDKPIVKKPRALKPTPRSTSPRVIASTQTSPHDTFKVPPVITPKSLPKMAQDAEPEPLAGEDMQAYIQRQKEYQQRKQGYNSRDIADANPDNLPSAETKRNKAINENLKFGGSNGIFEIKNMGVHSAMFSFKGWKNNNISRAISENIEVEAADSSDLKLAIIRKMIVIIRREYKGEFNWESQRLGRVIPLSARREDNSGLESFLMQEFFGPGGAYRE